VAGCAANSNRLRIHYASIAKRTKICAAIDCAVMLKEQIIAKTTVSDA